jgi:hypothetical protein
MQREAVRGEATRPDQLAVRPGSISPLNGFFTNGIQHVPVTGTAFTRADGSVDGQIYGCEATWAPMPCNMLPVP